jgi:hypothetical protein
MIKAPLREDFLHYLWKVKKIPTNALFTTDGREVSIVDYGQYNTDAGPDFFHARILLDKTLWVGNIEMHVFSSDWYKHRHDRDAAYENVILHVVYEHDQEIRIHGQSSPIPTLALKGHIPKSYLRNYLALSQSTQSIPCKTFLADIPVELVRVWMESLTIQRISRKAVHAEQIFQSVRNDWEETLHILLGRYYGARVNMDPFEMVARHLPLSLLMRNRTNRVAIEAMVFGQAGMLLAHYPDAYFQSLRQEFGFLQRKYSLKPLEPRIWKFSRLRPDNFPTIRLAQFSSLVASGHRLFSLVLEAEHSRDIKSLLLTEPSEYWQSHYRFGKEAELKDRLPGQDFLNVLIINAIVPLLHLYALKTGQPAWTQKALDLLEGLPSEENMFLRQWASAGVHASSAFDSQALLHLRKEYCDQHRCLSCRIGHEIIKS